MATRRNLEVDAVRYNLLGRQAKFVSGCGRCKLIFASFASAPITCLLIDVCLGSDFQRCRLRPGDSFNDKLWRRVVRGTAHVWVHPRPRSKEVEKETIKTTELIKYQNVQLSKSKSKPGRCVGVVR